MQFLLSFKKLAKTKYQSLEGNIKLPANSNEDIFSIKPRLSRIAIDRNYKVYLIDYNKIEIVMTPLPKALFILFLKHPEGILLKSISEYKQELLSIYEHISYRETRNEIFKSINEVTNPSSNSINEKCSRIKEAFVKHFDESIACHYYVTGERGKEKRIIINRDLVIWDINIEDINETAPLTEKQKIDKENEVMMLINVGKESLNDRKYSLAIQYFTRVIELDKFNAQALFMRGVGHLQLGKYKEAEEDNTKALEILPNYGLCFHNRAEARFMMKNFDSALKDITYYLAKINNNSKDSYYLRGLVRSELGDIDNACQDWFNALHFGHNDAKKMLLKYPKIKIRDVVFEKNEYEKL
jgi:tetratricopeptide (TPR) repeat protein